ncbi:MAG: hypothetical protein K5634_04435 [Sphaerochaetaceae bacterium]|nr:hypothetical protein [Sphaerochaetaceae bacterium]
MNKTINLNPSKKIILIIVLMLIGMAVYASDSITLGDPSFTNNNTYFTFPNAVINSNQSFYTLSITVDKGSINDPASDSDYSLITDNLSPHKSITFVFTDAKDSSYVQDKLRSVTFVSDHYMTVNVSVSANESSLPSDMKMTSQEIDGVMHYYGYVNYDGTYGGTGVTWREAYVLAKSCYFEGMKGYLATITCDAENTILDNISLCRGWAGGARINMDSNPTLDADTADAYTHRTDYAAGTVDSSQNNTNNSKWTNSWLENWYWVCGPEHGKNFYEDNYKYYPETSSWSSGEPNNYGYGGKYTDGNWVLEVHFGSDHKWNDMSSTKDVTDDDNTNAGYFIEFSNYDGGTVSGYDASNTLEGSTIVNRHQWTVTADDTNNKFKATCSVCDTTIELGVGISVE